MGEARPRVWIGVALWGCVVGLIGWAVISPSGAAHQPARKLVRFASEQPCRLEISFDRAPKLERGDPVFTDADDDFLAPVGRVVSVRSINGSTIARLSIFPERAGLLREGLRARALTVPQTAAWVVDTLVPAERRAEIRDLASDFLDREGEDLKSILWPEVRAGLTDILALYEEQLPAAIAARSESWEAVLSRYREGPFKEELMPALTEIVLPLARERFSPLMDVIGKELWDALPVWGLGWRAVWQEFPGTKDDHVKERFEKYLQEDAEPILARHGDEIAEVTSEVLREAIADPRVREAATKSLKRLAEDPELGYLVTELLKELVFENDRLMGIVKQRWEGGLKAAAAAAAARMEPLIRRVFDSVVLDESRTGINPRLARVLRARVFRKDARWVLLTAGEGEPLADGARVKGKIGE